MSPRTLAIMAGVAGLGLIAGFFYLLNVADTADPARQEKRIELPDAFKE